MAFWWKRAIVFAPLLASGSVLHFDEAGAKAKPISKVVDLLKEMSTRLDEDQNTDQDIFDKTKCWCSSNLDEKPKAIAAAKEQIAQLTSASAEAKATSERLAPEIRKMEQSLQDSKNTLDKAYSIRVQQMNAFKEDEASLMESIKQVGDAAEKLGVKAGAALLQVKPDVLAETVRKVLDTQASRLVNRLSHSDRVTLENFLQDPGALMKPEKANGFLQAGSEETPSTSDGIAGILQSMGDDFATDLQKELDQEKVNKKSYEELNAAKQVEISSTQASITAKTEQKAAAALSVAEGARDIKALQKTLAADEAFLKAVQGKCSGAEEEFAARQQARSEETGAISQAIEVLTSDEARDLAFLQEASTQHKELASRAADVLTSAGKKLGKEALVTMALELKGAGFDKVKKAMDEMVSALKAQQADEVKEKDTCEENLRQNELETDEKDRLKSVTEGKVATLTTAVKKATAEIEALNTEVAEMQKQIQVAGENRQKENTEFQASIAEQKETQAVLKKAQKVLTAVYSAPALVQVRSHSQQAQPEEIALGAPEGFKEMKKNSGGAGVVQLLSSIIEDSRKMEAEATKDEQEAQGSYESFLADNDAAIRAMGEQLLLKQQEKAESGADLAEAKESLTSATEELSQLKISKVQLEGDCNYLLRNFELRQKSRSEELESIKEAKAMLSGAKFS